MSNSTEYNREYQRNRRQTDPEFAERTREACRRGRAENPDRVKESYRKYRQKNNKKLNEEYRKRRARKLLVLGRLKMLYGCEICRSRPHPRALDFHHRDPQTKKFSLSQGCSRRGWESIRKELKKCAVLCANCHRQVK